MSLRDVLADGWQRYLAGERTSNFVTPFVGAKTSQTDLILVPFNPGLNPGLVYVVLRLQFS